MGKFDSKVVIVTGSSSGIGEATAIAFAKEGANVTVTGRNAERLAGVAEKCRKAGAKVLEIVCELTKFESLELVINKTVEAFGALDILVNNAGSGIMGPVEKMELNEYEELMQLDVRAPIFLCKYALPHLRKTKGCIVNVSSSFSTRAYPGMVVYCLTKAAMDHFTRGLASECVADGIRVNTINPGMVVTRFMDPLLSEQDISNFRKDFSATKQPLGAVPKEEIASGILYLCGATSATGTSLVVDGGLGIE